MFLCIDAHFVYPPDEGAPPTAVWCEAAVDGVVWYDRDGLLTRRLADVRRAIAEGRVVRGISHGQPYWKADGRPGIGNPHTDIRQEAVIHLQEPLVDLVVSRSAPMRLTAGAVL